jgi:hypothetical protein
MVHDPFEKGNVREVYPVIADDLLKLAAQHHDKFYEEHAMEAP